MKRVILLILTMLAVACADDASKRNDTMPELNVIKTTSFSAPYGCGGSYEESALFLSSKSKNTNAPDLLFNGPCKYDGSIDFEGLYIEAKTAGDDIALISDLGDVELEEITSSKALNMDNRAHQGNTFKTTQGLKENHVYVVTLSKGHTRALYALKVNEISADGSLEIDYVVKNYVLHSEEQRSAGFDWDVKNHKSKSVGE